MYLNYTYCASDYCTQAFSYKSKDIMSVIFWLLHVNCWMEQSIFDIHFYHLQLVVKGVGELLMSAQMFNNG